MGRLEHLSGIKRMEVGVIVLETLGDVKKHPGDPFRVFKRGVRGGQSRESCLQLVEGIAQNAYGILLQYGW
jgi:hypothetical protein